MNFLEFAVKVQQIAKIGLLFSKDDYAIENYQELEKLSRECLNDGMVEPKITKNIFERDLYPTPSSSVRVLVFNDEGELLMVQEAQDGTWSVPGGWCEIFIDLKENAQKEVKEEAGIDIAMGRLLGIFRREKYKDYPTAISEYVHYFCAKPLSDDLQTNHETLAVGYFPLDDLPTLSRKNSQKELELAFAVYFNQLEAHMD